MPSLRAFRQVLPGVYEPLTIAAKLAPDLAGTGNAYLMERMARLWARPQNRSERFCTSRRHRRDRETRASGTRAPRAAAGIDVLLALPGIEKTSVERRKRSFQRGRGPCEAVRR